jgi:arsenate reductase
VTPVNIDLEAQLLRTIDRLSAEFDGMFSRETVERFARESFASLLETAEVTTFLPLFADRFARDRLKALAQADQLVAKEQPEVLYVCVHNAGRSQMAALLTGQLSGGRVHVRSAGSDPGDRVNPLVVEAMTELGLDMSTEFPKPLTDEVVRAADAVITMGCGDACPIYPGKRYEDWELSDPAEATTIEQVRAIREEVRGRVEVLLGELGVPPERVPAGEAGGR